MKSMLSIKGYDLLGIDDCDGIRYAWKYSTSNQIVESAAFPQHRKNTYDSISGYTTSISLGCILQRLGYACKFCRTGTLMQYEALLSPFDIAKQNIFMVLSDISCSDHMKQRQIQREFAYMGQGEPGYSYHQLREAIKLTDIAMKILGQKVHRHIISTAGIPDMITAYKHDVKEKFFTEKVTLHFSLHATDNRQKVMPINEKYPYHSILETMRDVKVISGEKPCIGILLFKNYVPHNDSSPYSNDIEQIKNILNDIDPQLYRLSFCEFNASTDIGKSEIYDAEEAQAILSYAIENGYDAKLFSSFGQEESTACGMLSGKVPSINTCQRWNSLEKDAESLISEAYSEVSCC